MAQSVWTDWRGGPARRGTQSRCNRLSILMGKETNSAKKVANAIYDFLRAVWI